MSKCHRGAAQSTALAGGATFWAQIRGVQGPIMLSLEKYLFMIDDFKIELLLIFQFFCCCCLFCVCFAELIFYALHVSLKTEYTNKQRFREKTTHNPVTQTLHVVNPSGFFFLHVHS